MNRLRSSLFKRTFIYTFSAALNSLIAFLLLPVLTRYLTPFDYGVIETFLAVVTCLTGVIMYGGTTLIVKDYFVVAEKDRQRYTGEIAGFILIVGLITVVAGELGNWPGGALSLVLKLDRLLIFLAVVVATANAVNSLMLTILQLEKDPRRYALLVNSRTFVEICISLYCIIVVGLGWQGRITGITSTSLLLLAVTLVMLRRRGISPTWPGASWRQITRLGAPLVVAHVTGWTNEAIGRLMIANMISVESTGVYSIGYRFGMVVMMVETAFSLAWMPYFYESIRQDDPARNRQIVKVTYAYIVLLGLFAVAFGSFGCYLLYFMVDPKFHGASAFIFLVSVAYFFDGVWKMFIGYLIHHGRMATYSNIVLLAAVVNVSANYTLLPRIGLIGAAWATVIAYALGAALTLVGAMRLHPMPWSCLWDSVGPPPEKANP